MAKLGPFRPSLVVSFYQRGTWWGPSWETLTCVLWNLGVYLKIGSRGWCFSSRDSWRSGCAWEKSWGNYPPRPLWPSGNTEGEHNDSLAPCERVWSERRIRLCDAAPSQLGWVEAGIISVAEWEQSFPSAGSLAMDRVRVKLSIAPENHGSSVRPPYWQRTWQWQSDCVASLPPGKWPFSS